MSPQGRSQGRTSPEARSAEGSPTSSLPGTHGLCTNTAVLPTPHFVISEARLLANLERIAALRRISGAKVVLALKCFSTWGVFDLIRPFVDGTTSSSVYEARLGHETFGGETHAYSVGFSGEDVEAVDTIADKIIFNSLSQYRAHAGRLRRCRSIGLRINPEVSYARQTLADPARPCSRLGVRKVGALRGSVRRHRWRNAPFQL